MKYHTIAVFVMWLILGTGLAAAGTLTVSLQPSLDGKWEIIRATSITKADPVSPFISPKEGAIYKTATIINGIAQFNLSANDTGDRFIRINDLNDDLIPTRIDDPTKDINQFVGQKLRVSVIGNLSDPIYQIKTFTKTDGVWPKVWCSDGTSVEGKGTAVYIIQSLKTKPQKLEIKYLVSVSSEPTVTNITDYTSSAPTHPSTMTSIYPPFSKWVFGEGSHGVDYGGNDSKCNVCHGNLDTKPANLDTKRNNFTDIQVNNGFCFRCHYGKSGTDAGFVGEPGCRHPYPTNPIPPTTTAKPTAMPKAPAFETLSAIAALLVVVLIGRK